MPHRRCPSRFQAVAVAFLLAAGGCSSNSGVTAGSGGSNTGGSAGSGGSSVHSSGGNASGGSAGSSAGGKNGSGGSSSGGSAGNNSGGKTGSGGYAGSNSGGSGDGTGGKNSMGGNGGKGGSNVAGGAGGGGSGGTNMGSAGGAGGQTSTDAPTSITGLKIEANSKCVLSAYASWTTDKAADSVVQFGESDYEWEISDSALVTSHKVLIIGMHAAKAYKFKAISSNGGSSVNATTTYTTGALPSQIPVATVSVNDTTNSQSGWTLMNILKTNSTSSPIGSAPSAAVMYDANGQPVWYYIDGTTNDYGGAISTQLTDKGVVIGPVVNSSSKTGESPREVDFAGNTLWQCADSNCGSTDGYLTHHATKLSNGDYVVCRWSSTNSNPIFEEFTSENKKVWSLDYAKLVPMPSGKSGDWCHGNSITVDIENDAAYANCRWMGLIKVKYSDPTKLVWHIPASYNAKGLGNITFSPSTSQYSDTHDPEIHSDGTILFFDNGGYSYMSTTTYHSRAVEYKIDESAKTATLVWEFPGTFSVDSWYKNSWYTSYFGDADRLANGNVLITAGSLGASTGDARVFEVMKADGKVVWEFKLPTTYGVYRADRITPPLVHAIRH